MYVWLEKDMVVALEEIVAVADLEEGDGAGRTAITMVDGTTLRARTCKEAVVRRLKEGRLEQSGVRTGD